MSHQNLITGLLFSGILLVIATNMPASPGIQQPAKTITQASATSPHTQTAASEILVRSEWETGPYPALPTFDAVMP